jgi:hypothetical protein
MYVGLSSLQCHGSLKWVCLGVNIKQNHWSILKNKSCNFLPIKTRCSNVRAPTSIHIWCGHRHRRSRNCHVHSKIPGCCLLFATAFAILFNVNWRSVNHVSYVRKVFNSHKTHVWPEANPHAASVHCHLQHFAFNAGGGALCLTFH